ncbi:formate dehydrogenase accessory sulfurtransferase FdhD [uncultured Clostridium sp.]|uniref:formate dehydrogenase accessory sulfurtransferase FdhD n=1 Tax=uncultured Clostridium sp. TaxID=59620 RepID=UPI0028E5322A|nr:formate dehydrogenase accessory sulfurtransferase FdhD [uncultured Clostridium sp.]
MTEILKTKKLNVCEESAVDLVLNGKKLVTFMCTPENLNELAMGHLYNRGLVKAIDDVYVLSACDEMREIYVTTSDNYSEDDYSLAGVLASGCGSGSVFKEEFLNREKNSSDLKISLNELKELSIEMFSNATKYKETGGMHCASLVYDDKLLVLREDVGRHNAIDKVIGKGVFLGLNLNNAILMTTGRISSDMILKAIGADIPIVVSRSIPSSLALEIAEKLGITVVGRIVSKEPIVYTHSKRII